MTTGALAVWQSPLVLVCVLTFASGTVRGVFTLIHATAVVDRWGVGDIGHRNGILTGAITATSASRRGWARCSLPCSGRTRRHVRGACGCGGDVDVRHAWRPPVTQGPLRPSKPEDGPSPGRSLRRRRPTSLSGKRASRDLICAPVGIRTPNLLIRSQMLYPLSYRRSPSAVRRERLVENSRPTADGPKSGRGRAAGTFVAELGLPAPSQAADGALSCLAPAPRRGTAAHDERERDGRCRGSTGRSRAEEPAGARVREGLRRAHRRRAGRGRQRRRRRATDRRRRSTPASSCPPARAATTRAATPRTPPAPRSAPIVATNNPSRQGRLQQLAPGLGDEAAARGADARRLGGQDDVRHPLPDGAARHRRSRRGPPASSSPTPAPSCCT